MYAPKAWSSTLLHLCLRFPIVTLVTIGLCIAVPGLFWPQEGNKCFTFCPVSMVTLVFDDGYKSVIEKAFPLMEKYGFKGTVYVATDLIGQPGYMSWEDLQFLQANGWEIASHSVTHSNLVDLDEEVLRFELAASKQVLEEHGLRVRHFASPYGEYNERVLQVVAEYYDSHRTAWPAGLNDLPVKTPEDRYRLKAVEVDFFSIEEIKTWIDLAIQENKWLILLFHRIGEEKDAYNVSLEYFEEVLRYLSEKNAQQFPQNFFIDPASVCQDISSIWKGVRLLFSSTINENNRVCLVFAIDWQGEGNLCFRNIELQISTEDHIVVRYRTSEVLTISPGITCFTTLTRVLEEGEYTVLVTLEDCNGLTWQGEFFFTLGPDCQRYSHIKAP